MISVVGLDLAPAMVARAADLLSADGLELCVANAEHLPLPDASFDAVLHFGFLNEFADRPRAIREFLRVLRPGRRAVLSDDGVVPMLRATPWAQKLTRQNPSFGADPPLTDIPNGAAFSLEWFSGVFYILTLTKPES